MTNVRPARARATENVLRGTLLTLVVIPVGVAVWLLLWNINVIGSIVAFGIAWLAVRLYQFGSGGFLSRAGSIRIIVITAITVLLSVLAAMVSDVATQVPPFASQSAFASVFSPDFWSVFWPSFPGIVGSYGVWIIVALVFSGFGCFVFLRRTFSDGSSSPRGRNQGR